MHDAMGTTKVFLISMATIFSIPYLIWRLGKTDYYAPLVIVQIITGILLGPVILGKAFPDYRRDGSYLLRHHLAWSAGGKSQIHQVQRQAMNTYGVL